MPRIPVNWEAPGDGAFPSIIGTGQGWTNVRRYSPAFPNALTTYWLGKIMIPGDYPVSAPLRFRLVSNAVGGNVRMQCAVHKTNGTGPTDQALGTVGFHELVGPATIALSGTAKSLISAVFSVPFVSAIGDTLSIKLTRFGGDALDTSSVTIYVWDAHLDTA